MASTKSYENVKTVKDGVVVAAKDLQQMVQKLKQQASGLTDAISSKKEQFKQVSVASEKQVAVVETATNVEPVAVQKPAVEQVDAAAETVTKVVEKKSKKSKETAAQPAATQQANDEASTAQQSKNTTQKYSL